MASSSDDAALDRIAAGTLGHYGANAAGFWEGTKDHDVAQNREALLHALGGKAPLRILDFGCGPGRDLVAFRDLGHTAVGLDGCEPFVEMARAHSGCEVLHQSFFRLALSPGSFDGIFANASLFHVPQAILPRVLGQLRSSLVPDGVLFCSNPRAFHADAEGWQGDRYSAHLTVESWTAKIASAGFALERQYLRPAGKPPGEQPWIAMVWRRTP